MILFLISCNPEAVLKIFFEECTLKTEKIVRKRLIWILHLTVIK